METMILSLLKDVEYFYEPVSNAYKLGDTVFIHKDNSKFSIHKAEHGFANASFIEVYSTYSAEDFLAECNSRHLDLQSIENTLNACILDEAVYAKMKTTKALKYFTEEEIEERYVAWKNFSKLLIAKIEESEGGCI